MGKTVFHAKQGIVFVDHIQILKTIDQTAVHRIKRGRLHDIAAILHAPQDAGTPCVKKPNIVAFILLQIRGEALLQKIAVDVVSVKTLRSFIITVNPLNGTEQQLVADFADVERQILIQTFNIVERIYSFYAFIVFFKINPKSAQVAVGYPKTAVGSPLHKAGRAVKTVQTL